MPTETTRYPLSQSARAQAVGLLAVLAGVGVLLALGLTLAGLDTVRWVVVGCTALLGLALTVAVVRFVRAPTALELSEHGYRVKGLRGVGVRQAAWADVHHVATRSSRDQQVVVLTLADGIRTTTLPVPLIGAAPREWLADLDTRLNASRGHRRL